MKEVEIVGMNDRMKECGISIGDKGKCDFKEEWRAGLVMFYPESGFPYRICINSQLVKVLKNSDESM